LCGERVCQVDEWICISGQSSTRSAPYHFKRMKALSSSQGSCAHMHAHAQGPPTQPIVVGVGASKLLPAGKGVQKFAAPTLLAKALRRNVLRGAGGTAGRAVMVLPLNEHRTTVCCSRCRAATQAATVRDREAGVQRPSMRLRDCLQCCRRCEQAQKEGSMAAGTGAGSSGVRQPRPGYLMHRDLNAAWNLWNACCAEFGCARRPGYLSAHA